MRSSLSAMRVKGVARVRHSGVMPTALRAGMLPAWAKET